MNRACSLRVVVAGLALLAGAAATAQARQVSPAGCWQAARGLRDQVAAGARLPDQVSVATADGATTLTMGQALLVFADVLGELTRPGPLPAGIEVADDARAVAAGVPTGSPNAGAPVAMAALGGQCRALGEIARLMGGLPVAVWVEGRRLTLAEFAATVTGALAAVAEGGPLPAQVIVPRVSPPPSWANGIGAGWRTVVTTPPAEDDQPPAPNPTPPARSTPPPPEPRPLSLSLADGATISGSVVVRVDIWPLPKMLALFVDGRQRALLNFQPYQFPLDTRRLENGPHRIRVEAQGAAGGTQAIEIGIAVANE
jgi:hypothetical protein